jgi:hypothetical protein
MRRVAYGILFTAAVIAGVAVARTEPPAATQIPNESLARTHVRSGGLTCPAGDTAGGVIIDGWEHRPTATAERAIAALVPDEAPEVPFDAEARVDRNAAAGAAEFALRDGDGYVVARFRAVRLDDDWVPEGWSVCSSFDHDSVRETEASGTASEESPGRPNEGRARAAGNGTNEKPAVDSRFTSIDDALVNIAGGPDVPTVLPSELPRGVRLADRHPLYEPAKGDETKEWILHLTTGQKDSLLVSYGGHVNFDGCDVPSARRVSVSGTPGLLALSRQNDRVVWSQLVWPANHAYPVGRYGLSGSLPPSQLLEVARTMPRVQPSWLAPGAC